MRTRIVQVLIKGVSILFAGLVVWAFIEAVQTEPAVVGSVATVVVGVYGVIWQQRQAEQSRLREAHRDRMTPVYEDLLTLVLNSMDKSKRSQAKTENFMRDLKGETTSPGWVQRHDSSLQHVGGNHVRSSEEGPRRSSCSRLRKNS